jgi:hypothetical protein
VRLAIIAAGGRPIHSRPWFNGMHPNALPLVASDRRANGEAFEDERLVRLPRRMSRYADRYYPISHTGPTFDHLDEWSKEEA